MAFSYWLTLGGKLGQHQINSARHVAAGERGERGAHGRRAARLWHLL